MSLFYIGHPKETDLALFAGGELGPLARWRIERHLQSCDACQTDVADFFHLQGDLEELSELPSSVDWDAMSLRIREAVAEADEVRSEPAAGFFQKPLAWQLGLATAAVFCGFIVVQQFPMQVADEQEVMTASKEQDAASSVARSLEDAEMPAAVGGSLAPMESLNEVRMADLKQKSQPVSDLDALAPTQERAQRVGVEKKTFELAVRPEEALPGDRFRAVAPPPPATAPESEPVQLASDLRANKNARGVGGRDGVYDAANAPAPAAPARQVEVPRKDDAAMTIAMADTVAGPGALREGFDQPVGEKKEASADEVHLANTRVTAVEQRMARAEGQIAEVGAQTGASFGASFAAQPAGLGTSITPAADGSEVVVDIKTDGGVRFRAMDPATGRITITDVYAQ